MMSCKLHNEEELFVTAGGADLAEDVLLDRLAAFVHDMHEAHAVVASVSEDVGDLEVAKGRDEFPPVAVELPDLELLETFQNSCWLLVASCQLLEEATAMPGTDRG